MAHFSRLQITLHWLTLLLIGIAYAAIELRGWAPKGSSVYLFMKDMHYDMGVLVWALMFLRLYLNHKYPAPAITPPLTGSTWLLNYRISHFISLFSPYHYWASR